IMKELMASGLPSIGALARDGKVTQDYAHDDVTDVYEYVLMEKKIVLGSWLKGNIYDCTPCFYFPVDNIEDLGNVIAEACYSDNKEISDEVKMKVLSRGWSNMIKRWDDMFIQLAYENKKSC
ncbi:MAG: hypothetical protein II670_06215, partial [Alphaproteobacteria bacterium]|nr:hypothetical protein [Alphaproteobacteria bacterium]